MPNLISTSELSWATGVCTQRKLVRLSDGTLYCTYAKELAGQDQIYVKKSTDDGANWTDETRISTYDGMGDYGQTLPSIAVDSNGYLHVVWRGMATGYPTNYQIWYAKYTTSWATPVRISTYAGMGSYIQDESSIAVDSNDYLHVVWHGKATGYTTNNQIWYAKYTTSWADPVRISTYEGMSEKTNFYASIAVDSNNYLHVAWCGLANGYPTNYQIWYAKYTTSWATPVRISTLAGMASYIQSRGSIAVDSNDYLHVVWGGRMTGYPTNYQVWYAKYTTSWATPVRISTYSGMINYSQFRPSIAVDSNDYLHVVWHGKATGYTDYDKVWYAKYTTSWATPECLQATGKNIEPNSRWSLYPASNIPNDGVDYVFTEGTASPYNIYWDKKDNPLLSLPTVTTQAVSGIEANSATGNGNITDNGGEDCDERGFVYGPSSYGDPGNTAPAASGYAHYVEETGSFGTGAFTGALTSLAPKTPYYVRAYAHNSMGYSYGDEVSFTTLAAIPTVTTDVATALSAIAATLNGTLNSDGGEACDCGFEWGLDTGYGFTTPTESKATSESFSQVIGGLEPGTTYHFRAFATNLMGTGYGADRSFTTALVLSKAYALAREEL